MIILNCLGLGVLGFGPGAHLAWIFILFFDSPEHRNMCLGSMRSKNTSIQHVFIKMQ